MKLVAKMFHPYKRTRTEFCDAMTLSRTAIKEKNFDYLRFIIDNDFESVNSKSESGILPIHIAAYEGDHTMIKYLIEKGSDVNAVSHEGYTPLHFAIFNKNFANIYVLINNGANVDKPVDINISRYDRIINDPLLNKNSELRKNLIHSTNIPEENLHGDTALHLAVRMGYKCCINVLLYFKANLSAINAEGICPIQIAVARGNVDIIKYLIKNGSPIYEPIFEGGNLLHYACKFEQIRVVRYLLSLDFDTNMRNAVGDTALHCACEHGMIGNTRMLLSKGADINAKGRNNLTPLHLAALKGYLYIVGVLVRKGADINAKSYCGITPLDYAKKHSHSDIIKFLQDNNAKN